MVTGSGDLIHGLTAFDEAMVLRGMDFSPSHQR